LFAVWAECKLTTNQHEETFEIWKYGISAMMAFIPNTHLFDRIHQTAHLGWLHFLVHKFYLSNINCKEQANARKYFEDA
jgi:hypothetical protein